MPPPKMLLASASPRRSELLALTGWPFEVLATDVDERPRPGEVAEELAVRLATGKALAAGRGRRERRIIVAADTLVVQGERILGKPIDALDAREMLLELRGRTHRVLTGLVLLSPDRERTIIERCESSVRMREVPLPEIDRYVASGSPLDKAGAYGIQDADFALVDRPAFGDCLANVMGLPLCHLARAARQLGLALPRDVPAACQAHLDYDCPVHKEILN
jgi:septum formation protein